VLKLLPESHRKRVRLLWGSIAIVVVTGLALVGVFFGNTGHSYATPLNLNRPAQVVTTPKTVPVSPAERRAAESTLTRFVNSAFIRRDLASSWPLATPHMRIGTTYAQWLAGDLPVFPYPAAALHSFGLTPKYSYKGVLGYDVLIVPNRNAAGRKAGQQVYRCELHQIRGRWLVDFCYQAKSL